MQTETAAMLNNMQHQEQQHYMSHLSQDHLMPEHHHHQQQQQQHHQVFTHLSSTTNNIAQQQHTSLAATNISLNEGLYTPPHLTSEECPPQYYSNIASRLNCSTSATSYSSSSSSSSSNDSNYPCSTSSSDICNKNNKNDTPSIGVNLRVTGQCSQGGRKYMEDYFSVAYQQSENAKDLEYAFIGIYDGHGGAEAAKFAKEHLMMEIINQRLFWSDNDQDVLKAIREGYIATHYAMWREQDKWPKTANGLPSTAGTTATVAFIRREKIYIGHVGDSGIVLGYQNEHEHFWRAKQLTTDHKPESVEERTRIMNSGGKVVVKSGVPRVVWNRPRNASHRGPIRKKTLVDEIPFLAVARSLGDLWSYNSERNEFVVSPDPDVRVIPINPNTFRCLVFGTDGLWNVVSAQEAVNTVREKEVINERLQAQRGDSPQEGNQWTNPSKSLVEQALKTWSAKKMRADNTSVVTVILYPPGQGDHNTNTPASCKDTCALTNPPSFVQPISYGLEYTQVQAEVPTYDDATTYKEMALKYLPPEAYRNFNYYADESDNEENDTDESEEEEQEMMHTKTPGDLLTNHMQYQQHLPANNWNWQHTNMVNHNVAINHHEEAEGEEEDEDMEEEEEDDQDEPTVANEREVCIINYQNYVHMEAEETNNATDSYINTFTESYNTILTATPHEECANTAAISAASHSSSSSSNSNSNSNCQSVTPPNGIHALLQEQQLYQQQCMSEEDGYSLTKLETRREQQTLKTSGISHTTTELASNAQTFKIFHEASHQTNQQQSPQMDMYHTNTDERFYHLQHQQFMPQLQPQKPLELHSLLQQEREEEQQVAYERLQAAQQQQNQNITAYACLQANRPTESTLPFIQPAVITPMEEENPMLEEEVEYLEEEILTETESVTIEQDKSVQINEISSSSCEDIAHGEEETFVPPLSSTMQRSSSQIIAKMDILPDVIFESPEEIDEADIVLNATPKSTSLTISKNKICLPPPSPLALTPIKTSITPHTKRSKSSYLYPNVPNENLQRISHTNQHSIFSNTKRPAVVAGRRSICMTPSGSNMTPPVATSTPMIQRQLRSTTTPCSSNTPMDYGKRTLRTRNSLAKDMKAKTSLVQAALKFPHTAHTRNFLRTTAASLLQGKSTPTMLLNDSHLTACNRRSLGVSNSARSVNRSIKTSRRDKNRSSSMNQSNGNLQHSSHHLNLRSRQSPPSSPTNTNTSALRTPSPAVATPVIKRASLSDRRSLRTIHTRSSSTKGSQTMGNFSKSTRTQSTGSNLAAPPPSPKLINAAAAVAAATRARSLITAKHTADANGTQSVVTAVFGKRTSLRSNGTTSVCVSSAPSNTNSSVASARTHQTLRGRIVKKLKR